MGDIKEKQKKSLSNFNRTYQAVKKKRPVKTKNFAPHGLGSDKSLFAFVLVPQSWLEKSEENFKTFLGQSDLLYNAFGGATVSASDQANSLSQAHRNAAGMVAFSTDMEKFWSVLFPKMFDISDKTNFPPVFGSNHAAAGHMGPRKDNWTAVCPPEWTIEERNAGCISFQETIYGTELLNRLEAIKKAVDPNFMFDCQNCIGNNRPQG